MHWDKLWPDFCFILLKIPKECWSSSEISLNCIHQSLWIPESTEPSWTDHTQMRAIVNRTELYLKSSMIIDCKPSWNKSTSDKFTEPHMRPWSSSSHLEKDSPTVKPHMYLSQFFFYVSLSITSALQIQMGSLDTFGILKHNVNLLNLIFLHFTIVHL